MGFSRKFTPPRVACPGNNEFDRLGPLDHHSVTVIVAPAA
jgi:hypothetical protein